MSRAIWLLVGLTVGAAAGWRAKAVSSMTLAEDTRQAIAEAMAQPGVEIPFRSGHIKVMDNTEEVTSGS